MKSGNVKCCERVVIVRSSIVPLPIIFGSWKSTICLLFLSSRDVCWSKGFIWMGLRCKSHGLLGDTTGSMECYSYSVQDPPLCARLSSFLCAPFWKSNVYLCSIVVEKSTRLVV